MAKTMDSAISQLHELCNKLHEQGFVLTGALHIVRPKKDPIRCTAEYSITPDQRVGLYRLRAEVNPVQLKAPPIATPLPAHLSPEDAITVLAASAIKAPIKAAAAAAIVNPLTNAAPTGNICPNCHGSNLKRSGTCETCQDCGSTTGCG